MKRLIRHDWPGNVRELRNLILAAHAQSDGGPIDVTALIRAHPVMSDESIDDRARRSFRVLKRELLDDRK
jgi:transcriptional regulator of acetoin/glycerol metabolism